MYPEEMIAPMRKEVTDVGFTELRSADDAEQAINKMNGTALVFINSVCGCAAGMARPGLAQALKDANAKPDHLYTVFAGNDKDATEKVRSYFHGYPPTSPSFGLFKDGKIVSVIQRLDIEGHNASEVANQLLGAFESHCN